MQCVDGTTSEPGNPARARRGRFMIDKPCHNAGGRP
jgi:hypothetical protein